MKPSAVLLIDLENFYCSREDYCRPGPAPTYDRARFNVDLDRLLSFARSMTADRATGVELPFTVRRAYADFNAVRYLTGAAPQYYLRPLPDELLSQGVEPVQVFRLSRGGGGRGSKNAADMRMAMDATSLLFSARHVEHFVLVTGDADFIPVILELKRHGHTVSVIGVTGATSPKIQRFVDNFELFEDLLAAEEVEAKTGELAAGVDGLGPIAGAVQKLLARTRPLRFAAVKPLLSKELGHPFDPGLFGCDTTGDFLRNNQAALGVVIRQGQHDSEIDLPGAPAPSANGTGGPRRAPEKPAARQPARPPEPHTAAHYRQLLATPRAAGADRDGKVYAVPWPALVWACDAVVPLLTPPDGKPTHTTKLQPKLIVAADGTATPDLVKHVRLFYPTLRAGLPVQGADGVYSLPTEITGEQIRRSVLGHIAHVLRCRLAEGAVAGDVRPDQLAAVFEPGEVLERATAEFAAVLTEPPRPAPEPAPEPGAEELHTPAWYVKLLKLGGPKGSETESFKVLPVPWASVERVCNDAFALLAPAAGGGPLPRDQVTARLVEAGKEQCPDKYDQHVRRVLGVLRLSGDTEEANGVTALGAEVVSGSDLRGRALAFLLQLLQLRLEERGVYDPIRPHAFVAALEAGPLGDGLAAEVAPAIAWLYRPGDEQPTDAPAAEALAEPAGSDEAALADVLNTQPAPVRPAEDSGVLVVRLDPSDGTIDLGPAPTSAEPPAPEPARPEPEALPVFAEELPEIDTGNDPVPPEVRHEAERPTVNDHPDPHEEPEFAPSVGTAADSSEDFAIDLTEITSEAVAAAAAELTLAPASKIIIVPQPPSKVVRAETGAGAAAQRSAEAYDSENLLGSRPPANWLSDGDSMFPRVDSAERVSARPVPPPFPSNSVPDQDAGEVDKMKPPPLPRRTQPPPLPPPEPE